MIRLFVIGIAIVFFVNGASAQSAQDDNPVKRLAAAERYAAVFNFSEMIGAMINETVRNSPPNQQAQLGTYLRQSLDGKQIHKLAVDSMMLVFTTDELNALADFYGSATGRSIVAKMPRYMGVVMPRLQAELAKSVNLYMQQH